MPKQLEQIIDEMGLDKEALGRVRNRVFVVGRFDQTDYEKEKEEQSPRFYLFTDRDLSETYKRCFGKGFLHGLNYQRFIQALRPAAGEKLEKRKFVTRIMSVIPGEEDGVEGQVVIDFYNWFFQRGQSTSEQQDFVRARPKLPKELLETSDTKRGLAILKLTRRDLQTYCEFQIRHGEIIAAFVQLLSLCGGAHDLPAYPEGASLPAGFPEKLIRYLYSEDPSEEFKIDDDIEFVGHHTWDELGKKQVADTFCSVVGAFREAMLGDKIEQYTKIKFKGLPLSQLARQVVKELQKRPGAPRSAGEKDLVEAFKKARDSFNGLRQILRSRVLLGMVLEWLIHAYLDRIPAVKSAGSETERNVAMGHAVLDNWKDSGLAAPLVRPDLAERKRFRELLESGFDGLFAAVVARSDEESSRLASKLPQEELRALVEKLRSLPETKGFLSRLAALGDAEKTIKDAFRVAMRMLLRDVLCPALYRDPTLTERHLNDLFVQEMLETYFQAIFMTPKDEAVIRSIAEGNRELFEAHIRNGKFVKEAEVVSALLESFAKGFVFEAEVQRRVAEESAVVASVLPMLKSSQLQQSLVSAAKRDADRTDGAFKAMDSTPVPPKIVELAIQQRVVEVYVQSRAAAVAAAGPSPSQGSSAEGLSEPGSTASIPASSPSADREASMAETSEMDRKIADILRKVESSSDVPKGGSEAARQEVVVAKATGEALKSSGFADDVAKNLKAFEKVLHRVYQQYSALRDKKGFRNKVERLTLINMMLMFQKELALGTASSPLYALLLDLIMELDPEDPDGSLSDFMSSRSLTLYFDNSLFAAPEGTGIQELIKSLDVQAQQSLDNIVQLVSELHGVKYLMEKVKDNRAAEIIVVNATADEFLNWLTRENLQEDRTRRGRLSSGALMRVTAPGSESDPVSDTAFPPGLVYMTDIAFRGGSKEAWLNRLSSVALRGGALSVVIPPICLSVGAESGYEREGAALAQAARAARGPVVILGPSPYLNSPRDRAFPTILPAGYLLAGHLLGRGPDLAVHCGAVNASSTGRFRVIGTGAVPVGRSIGSVVWGDASAGVSVGSGAAPKTPSQGGTPDGSGEYAFVADFYLFLVALMVATAKYSSLPAAQDRAQELLQFFYYSALDPVSKVGFEQTRLLAGLLHGDEAYRVALGQDLTNPLTLLRNVLVASSTNKNLLDQNAKAIVVTDIDWFNRVRELVLN
jgi:hypothetical protein